jgi:alanyl-tRNA synthetase
MVTVGGSEPESTPFSRELCGGTHLQRTGEIGYVKVLSEGSIGSGLRRIEAVTGRGAAVYFNERLGMLDSVSRVLQSAPEGVVARAEALEADLASARRENERLQRELARQRLDAVAGQARLIEGIRVLAARVDAASFDALREQGDWLRDRLGSAIIVLGALVADKPAFVAVVTPDLIARGYRAGDVVKAVAAAAGGSGGGRPEMAQAGGKDPARLDDALAVVATLVK